MLVLKTMQLMFNAGRYIQRRGIVLCTKVAPTYIKIVICMRKHWDEIHWLLGAKGYNLNLFLGFCVMLHVVKEPFVILSVNYLVHTANRISRVGSS